MEHTALDTLIALLAEYGISCDERRALLLVRHLDLVIEKNKVMNLTRITDASDALVLHIVDSLLPLACKDVKLSGSSTFVDMGTGAGFPGIPLGIMTDAQGTLIDSVGKKVSAVNEFISALGLENLVAEHGRLEDLACSLRGTQDYVFARALARTNILIEYAAPFLKMNGLLVVSKAHPDQEELEEAQRAGELCGLTYVSRETYELPRDLGHREILLYQKTAKAKLQLPRKAGTAKRDPLGV